MRCQILFSGKNKKNVINLSFAKKAQREVNVIYRDNKKNTVREFSLPISPGRLSLLKITMNINTSSQMKKKTKTNN